MRVSLLATLAVLASGCGTDASPPVIQAGGELPDPDGKLFTSLPASATGIGFENRLTETNERNVFVYRNYYNGGGVAIGDLNGDDQPDIVLTANETGPRLYLNQGGFRFREVTGEAGLTGRGETWTTGVALADVNGDGRLDMYIGRAGPYPPERRRNALWINQGATNGVPRFTDMAEAYRVADEGYTTHAAFLDHDGDGDLDLFVVNNSPRPVTSFSMTNSRDERDRFGGARLYRNDGDRFTDVTAAAGIHSPEMALGLGVAVSDVNRDGRPDIYVGNDFFERDYLYLNNGNGTFTDVAEHAMSVIAYFSMGLDIGDLDGDGWPDIYTTDMLPEDEYRLKTTSMFEGWEVYRAKVENGYHHQLSRNMLQRNNRDGTFSDVGLLAGVARTDWTWSALIADLDLDGRNDIFVTNGMAKDVTAQEYLAFLANDATMRAAMSGGRVGGTSVKMDFLRLTKAMPSTPIPNYAFHNEGGLRFTNRSADWGLSAPSFSSGAAYGDLDGDGALDLVVNNTNQVASVYRNNARVLHPTHRFLRVRLEGEGSNRFAVGARVTVFVDGRPLVHEQLPSRGFQSSMDYTMVFGAAARDSVDSVRVDWPDGRVSRRGRSATNQTITLAIEEARSEPTVPAARVATLFRDVTQQAALGVRHRENQFVDFDRERLLPKLVSTEGPPLAVGDVNGDGLPDLYLGGAKGQSRSVLLQRDGRWVATNGDVFAEDAISEDTGAEFFDANGDGRLDLYVVSGGSEYSDGASALQDRLYLNDGRGNFRKSTHLPTESASGSRPAVADYDGDGDLDVFVGGRVVPWRYGLDGESLLLRNDGRGRFTNVTESLAPGLARAGMVTDATWRDVDRDGRVDLVLVGEWMPVTIYRNTGAGRLERLAARGLEQSGGWWNRVVAGDFTGDGRVDFVLGNLGLNSRMYASADRPATMYVKDFDGNGFSEPILSWYTGATSHPLALRDDLLRFLPHLRPRLGSYAEYARKSVEDIFGADALKDAVVKRTHTFATSLARSNPDGSYTLVPLPGEAQVAPVYAILAEDVNGDRHPDLVLAGNFDGFKPEIGRMASGFGTVLLGDGQGGFSPVHSTRSGFKVPGQARDIRRVMTRRGAVYVVARNDDEPLVFARAP